MDINKLDNVYGKCLFENEKNITFWEKYLTNLNALDLRAFSEKLSVPVLVPIGSRILFRGELKHTNEVTVALGADYFAKCSADQAEILKQHKIKDAKSRLDLLKKERDYLQNQLSFSKQIMSDNGGHNIVEIVSEEEDKEWRKQHSEKVKEYKQRQNIGDETIAEMSNEELWNRLDELELQEDLENELTTSENKLNATFKKSRIDANVNEDTDGDDNDIDNDDEDEDDDDSDDDDDSKNLKNADINNAQVENELYLADYGLGRKIFQQPSKLHLFELVVERHNAVKEMISELRAKRRQCNNVEDLEMRLDDIDNLEMLEDEIAILEDMLASDDSDDNIEIADEDEDIVDVPKKTVVFAVEDSDTFELTFRHSQVEPCKASYDPQKGITKPSDILKAYSNDSNRETMSILKKPTCNSLPQVCKNVEIKKQVKVQDELTQEHQDSDLNTTIVVGDVVEKVNGDTNSVNNIKRPMSLFKKRRQQQQNE